MENTLIHLIRKLLKISKESLYLGIKQMGKKLLNGLVLAIEPIVNKGKK
ncbi:MAG: hypothetical protein ACKA35_01155 [Candidatus Karelsulcia muelleri]